MTSSDASATEEKFSLSKREIGGEVVKLGTSLCLVVAVVLSYCSSSVAFQPPALQTGPGGLQVGAQMQAGFGAEPSGTANENAEKAKVETKTAIVAGGCFWCVETDFEKAPGVLDVVSGYSGGRTKSPNYENYASGGHREVALVTYDPRIISYSGIVEWLIKHIDPTNTRGQFKDKGLQYSPAIYYADDEEKEQAAEVIEAINKLKVFRTKIRIAIEPREEFWPAEEYHQNYHHKNQLKYSFFRLQSGRDAFINRYWGARAYKLELPGSQPDSAKDVSADSDVAELYSPWRDFEKPPGSELRKTLTPLQFQVTQRDSTEQAFKNEYNANKKPGIYVCIVSGAPLFSSRDKFESGTGWPSFLRPITPEVVSYKVDRKNIFLGPRMEVRSKIGDTHLGHVFDDVPQLNGRRYCMNSAALRFIPKEEMEKQGYGAFLKFVE